jgi:hypothetical protein
MIDIFQTGSDARARHFASHRSAWHHSRLRKGFTKTSPPTDDLVWATMAKKGAISWFHVDTGGLCTVADELSGGKWWVVANVRRDVDPGSRGDLASIAAYGPNWGPEGEAWKYFDLEAVFLEPGTVL